MAPTMDTLVDRDRIRVLRDREEKRLDEQTRESAALYERARHSLANGVSSSYQVRDPWPIYVSHGRGSRVWDVDGRELVDFHNGFGSMVQGHANAKVVAAVQERLLLRSHLPAPLQDRDLVTEVLARRAGQPRRRSEKFDPQ